MARTAGVVGGNGEGIGGRPRSRRQRGSCCSCQLLSPLHLGSYCGSGRREWGGKWGRPRSRGQRGSCGSCNFFGYSYESCAPPSSSSHCILARTAGVVGRNGGGQGGAASQQKTKGLLLLLQFLLLLLRLLLLRFLGSPQLLSPLHLGSYCGSGRREWGGISISRSRSISIL